jgi:hypothetical protein
MPARLQTAGAQGSTHPLAPHCGLNHHEQTMAARPTLYLLPGLLCDA